MPSLTQVFEKVVGVAEDVVDFVVVDPFESVMGLISDAGDWLGETLVDALAGTEDEYDGVLLNNFSNVQKIPVVYGERLIGGTVVFVGSRGSNNRYLDVVVAFCEGEVEQIDNYYINDVDSLDPAISPFTVSNPQNGSTTQNTYSTLATYHPDQWSEAHNLTGVAYTYFRLEYDPTYMRSFPRFTIRVRGKICYDLRTSTTVYTTNPAIIIYDYLTNPIYGKGLSATKLNSQSFIDSADYCDLQYEQYSGGPFVNYFECNGQIDTSKKIIDNLKALLKTCRGNLPKVGGQYHLKIEKDETSVFTFDSTNIVDGSWSFAGTPKSVKLNRVKIKYTNKLRNWKQDIVSVVSDNDTYFINEDNNIRLEKTISYPFETDVYRAKFMGETMLKKSREGITVSFIATLAALLVEVGDVIDITHSTPGWTNKTFRVTSIQLLESGNIGFSFIEHTASVYDRTIPAGEPTEPDTNLPDPFSVAAPTGLSAFSGTDELLLGGDGTVYPRVRLSWLSPGDIFVTHYEIQFKRTTGINYQDATPAIGQAVQESYITGVEDGETYDIRTRAVNSRFIASEWISITHQVIGKTAPPPDVNTFLVTEQSDGTRQLSWTYPDRPVDHGGYEIRFYLGSTSDWDLMVPMHEDVITTSPWETNQLAAGEYTFAIKAVDTTYNYSENALFINVGLGDPRLSALLAIISPHANGWPGTKTDCNENERNELIANDQNTWADLA